jgi:hypothetical protein
MKRFGWTLAMAIAGFALGWHGQGGPSDRGDIGIATLWAACIGFGFGSIFDRRRPRNGPLVFYWVFTLALIGVFFSPLVPLAQFAAQVAVSGAIGALVGMGAGFAQVKFSDRRHER